MTVMGTHKSIYASDELIRNSLVFVTSSDKVVRRYSVDWFFEVIIYPTISVITTVLKLGKSFVFSLWQKETKVD